MKVTELLNEDDSVLIKEIFADWHDILVDEEHFLKKFEAKETSYKIGGSLSAVVSGKTGIRKNYAQHSRYGSPRVWDYMLELGNGLRDGDKKFDSLKHAQKILNELKDEAQDQGAETKWASDQKDFFFATMNGKTITACMEYGSAFTWVGIKKS